MSAATDLSHGFVVGILQNPAESPYVWELIEMDRSVRREDALLRSGPPVELTTFEQAGLNDSNWSMGIVAVDLATGRYIGYTSIHRIVTRCRGAKLEVEEVVSHPEFEGRGVGKALMAVALKEGFLRWSPRKVTLTSRASRVAARELYAAFGFVLEGEDRFVLKSGDELWTVPERCRPRNLAHEGGRTMFRTFVCSDTALMNAVDQICSEKTDSRRRKEVIEPIGVYKYKDAP